ncbi:MAG: radical SAM family heme chaperone HemW [Halieaceae bacterium]
MSRLQLPPLSLYIHIPWCERKCPYCDFNSHRADKVLPETDYIEALLEDLEADLALVQGRALHSIFIGGGTPSLMSGQAIAQLMQGIRERVALMEEAEVSMEANPGSAETDKFAAFVEAGINRLSLGVQSFDDAQLQALGRVHNSDQASCAIEMAQGVGLNSLNIDLMHGLPGQSAAAARADLQQAADYRPAHISWYQLTIEANTEFYKQPPRLPIENELAKIQDVGESLLRTEGFQSYEVSAYSRTGYRCHHNLNYWHFGDYLGIGAGAHGKITLPAENRVQRLVKRKQPAEYLAATADQRASRVFDIAEADLPGDFMLNALRLDDGFELAEFEARTGLDQDVITATTEQLIDRGLLTLEERRVHTTELGRRFLDSVVSEFL